MEEVFFFAYMNVNKANGLKSIIARRQGPRPCRDILNFTGVHRLPHDPLEATRMLKCCTEYW